MSARRSCYSARAISLRGGASVFGLATLSLVACSCVAPKRAALPSELLGVLAAGAAVVDYAFAIEWLRDATVTHDRIMDWVGVRTGHASRVRGGARGARARPRLPGLARGPAPRAQERVRARAVPSLAPAEPRPDAREGTTGGTEDEDEEEDARGGVGAK